MTDSLLVSGGCRCGKKSKKSVPSVLLLTTPRKDSSWRDQLRWTGGWEKSRKAASGKLRKKRKSVSAARRSYNIDGTLTLFYCWAPVLWKTFHGYLMRMLFFFLLRILSASFSETCSPLWRLKTPESPAKAGSRRTPENQKKHTFLLLPRTLLSPIIWFLSHFVFGRVFLTFLRFHLFCLFCFFSVIVEQGRSSLPESSQEKCQKVSFLLFLEAARESFTYEGPSRALRGSFSCRKRWQGSSSRAAFGGDYFSDVPCFKPVLGATRLIYT